MLVDFLRVWVLGFRQRFPNSFSTDAGFRKWRVLQFGYSFTFQYLETITLSQRERSYNFLDLNNSSRLLIEECECQFRRN